LCNTAELIPFAAGRPPRIGRVNDAYHERSVELLENRHGDGFNSDTPLRANGVEVAMSDVDSQESEVQSFLDSRQIVSGLLRRARRYYILLIATLGICGLAALLIAVFAQPTFEATATIGPPSTSLSANMLSGSLLSGGGGLSGIASKLVGGDLLGQSSDPFSVYVSLLTSNRLAEVLAGNEQFMSEVFYKRYDQEHHRWRHNDSVLREAINVVKSAIHYPIKTKPDGDDLERFLKKKLSVETSLTSAFVNVSFKFHDPMTAQEILNTILVAADNIAREDIRKDVSARLSYLERTLPTVTQADQRESLISLLSGQQEQMMIVAADKRFATSFVDPPHASTKPVFPNIRILGALSVFVGAVLWLLVVYLLPERSWLLRQAVNWENAFASRFKGTKGARQKAR
jgi:uncharacterized protein involved in exopolysaccharide biosynthesis